MFPYYYSAELKSSEEIEEEIREFVREKEKHHRWVKERLKLRGNLNRVDLDLEWLRKKPERSALEERVLMQLKNEQLVSAAGVFFLASHAL